MFLLPFLHYLKPFRVRIGFAFVCMFVVSIMGAGNILIFIPFLRVLLTEPEAAPPDEEPGVEFVIDEGEVPGAEPEKETGATEVGGFELSGLIPDSIKEGVLAPVNAKIEAFKSWYTVRAREDPIRTVWVLCALLLGMVALKGLAEYLSNYHLAHAFFLMNLKVKEDVFKSVMAQDYLFFSKHSAGYLNSRINSDSNEIRAIIQRLLADGIQQPLNLVIFFCLLVYFSPRMTLVTLLLLPPIAVTVWYFGKVLKKNTKRQKKKSDEIASTMTESLINIRLVKAFGTESDEIEKYVKQRVQLFRLIMRRRLVKFASSPIFELLGAFSACAIILIGAYAILGDGQGWFGEMDFETFGAYLFTMTRFYRPMKSLSRTTLNYQVAKVSAHRLLEMLRLEPGVAEDPDPQPFEYLREGVEIRDLRLRYEDKEILCGVNLKIPKGKMVAIVGASGSGKTTIANLVPRLFDPTEGQVLIDGIDLRRYRVNDLRDRLGIVTQQTILFDDTVANNIAYGHDRREFTPEQRQERIVEAAKTANAHEFIEALDGGKGYRTKIGPSGSRLSGGQAQRLAIARALYRDPEIIILDEATSALDSQSQALVQEAINHVLEGRTALVISHRLSTIRGADTIYVLSGGRVVEEGTFNELMAAGGEFYRLYQSEALAESA